MKFFIIIFVFLFTRQVTAQLDFEILQLFFGWNENDRFSQTNTTVSFAYTEPKFMLNSLKRYSNKTDSMEPYFLKQGSKVFTIIMENTEMFDENGEYPDECIERICYKGPKHKFKNKANTQIVLNGTEFTIINESPNRLRQRKLRMITKNAEVGDEFLMELFLNAEYLKLSQKIWPYVSLTCLFLSFVQKNSNFYFVAVIIKQLTSFYIDIPSVVGVLLLMVIRGKQKEFEIPELISMFVEMFYVMDFFSIVEIRAFSILFIFVAMIISLGQKDYKTTAYTMFRMCTILQNQGGDLYWVTTLVDDSTIAVLLQITSMFFSADQLDHFSQIYFYVNYIYVTIVGNDHISSDEVDQEKILTGLFIVLYIMRYWLFSLVINNFNAKRMFQINAKNTLLVTYFVCQLDATYDIWVYRIFGFMIFYVVDLAMRRRSSNEIDDDYELIDFSDGQEFQEVLSQFRSDGSFFAEKVLNQNYFSRQKFREIEKTQVNVSSEVGKGRATIISDDELISVEHVIPQPGSYEIDGDQAEITNVVKVQGDEKDGPVKAKVKGKPFVRKKKANVQKLKKKEKGGFVSEKLDAHQTGILAPDKEGKISYGFNTKPGDSGGGLFTENLELVGVHAGGGRSRNYGYSLDPGEKEL